MFIKGGGGILFQSQFVFCSCVTVRKEGTKWHSALRSLRGEDIYPFYLYCNRTNVTIVVGSYWEFVVCIQKYC